ncbi:MAG TPA: type I restriction-modification system subunit M N-terminal domain-containing protein [Chthoniobacterales bacterium]|nr:type I restriction-modification system subunit M N-terminal domain-containing protein [Chthoniobacterales bacterium]
MTDSNQKQLGNTLWSIADQLRGAMDADDFRDYMPSFLFLRYLSDNYETAAKKELGRASEEGSELTIDTAAPGAGTI